MASPENELWEDQIKLSVQSLLDSSSHIPSSIISEVRESKEIFENKGISNESFDNLSKAQSLENIESGLHGDTFYEVIHQVFYQEIDETL